MKFFIIFLCYVFPTQLTSFKTIQEAYKNRKTTPLQPIELEKLSLFQQKSELKKLLDDPSFKNFKGDPSLSGHFLLQKNVREEQSLWLMGKQLDQLKIQVTFQNEHNQNAVKIDDEGILMQIINHSEGTINSFVYVHQFKLQKIKINSELFEIKIMLPKESKGRKTVDVRMSLNEVKRDENQFVLEGIYNETKKMCEQSETIFLDSLQGWEMIKKHKKQYKDQQKKRTFSSLLELIFILVFNIAEIVLLKSQIQKRILI